MQEGMLSNFFFLIFLQIDSENLIKWLSWRWSQRNLILILIASICSKPRTMVGFSEMFQILLPNQRSLSLLRGLRIKLSIIFKPRRSSGRFMGGSSRWNKTIEKRKELQIFVKSTFSVSPPEQDCDQKSLVRAWFLEKSVTFIEVVQTPNLQK